MFQLLNRGLLDLPDVQLYNFTLCFNSDEFTSLPLFMNPCFVVPFDGLLFSEIRHLQQRYAENSCIYYPGFETPADETSLWFLQEINKYPFLVIKQADYKPGRGKF